MLSFYINHNQEQTARKVVSLFLARVRLLWEQQPNELVEYGADFWLGFLRNMVNGAMWDDCLFLLEVALSKRLSSINRSLRQFELGTAVSAGLLLVSRELRRRGERSGF